MQTVTEAIAVSFDPVRSAPVTDEVARVRAGSLLAFVSAILSGFCPGVCLLYASAEGSIVVAALMTLIFAATAVTAALGERRLTSVLSTASRGAVSRAHQVSDLLAGVGLLVINVAAYLFGRLEWLPHRDGILAALTCGGFVLLAATAWRAVPSYRMRAAVARAHADPNRIRGNGGFIALGYVKAIYETVWLSLCWIALALIALDGHDSWVPFGFGALLGLIGFAAIWLAMIVTHAILFARAQKRIVERVRGFEVLESAVAAAR